MLPPHDTRRAEEVVREELDAVEASLMEHGPLARGSAYAVLGHGHLLLREFESAEVWLAAALDSGLDDERVETALGIARAMLLLEHARDPVADLDVGGVPSVAEAVVNLSRRGPETADLDLFHRALALAVSGRTAEAIDAAHTSASRTPWLYEAAHLEGDLLVDRSKRRSRENDTAGAIADLERAGGAYARGLQIGRSDGWLHEAEAERSMLLARFLEPTDPEVEGCLESALEAAERASTIRPDRVEPYLLAARAAVLQADRLRARDGDAGDALATAERALVRASELDPDAPGLIDLQRRADELRSESRGADSR
jgi:serine/threonine-protein kinase